MIATDNPHSTAPYCVDIPDSPTDAAFDSVTAFVARKQAQLAAQPNEAAPEQIARDERAFRQAFVDSPVGMVTLSDDLLVLEANATFCDLLGYSETALLLTSIADLAHPDDREACLLLFSTPASGGLRTRQAESRCLTADGHVIWVAVTVCSTVDGADHRTARFLAQFEDITTRNTEAVRAGR